MRQETENHVEVERAHFRSRTTFKFMLKRFIQATSSCLLLASLFIFYAIDSALLRLLSLLFFCLEKFLIYFLHLAFIHCRSFIGGVTELAALW